MKTKFISLIVLVLVLVLVLACEARAANPTSFIYYSLDEVGSPRTNVITISPWPDTNTILGFGTNGIYYRARSYTPDTNGLISGAQMPNHYRLNISGVTRGVEFDLPETNTTVNLAELSGYPVVISRNFQVAQILDGGTLAYTNASDFLTHLTALWLASDNTFSNAVANYFLGNPQGYVRAAGTNSLTGSNNFTGVATMTNAANALGGDGSLITALTANSLATGTVPDARNSNVIVRTYGTNTFTGTNNFDHFGTTSNGLMFDVKLSAPILTNGVNYGDAFSSPGPFTSAEQFGAGAHAWNDGSTAVGSGAAGFGYYGTAIGQAAGIGSNAFFGTAVGNEASCEAQNAVAVGKGATASATNSTAIGYATIASHLNSTALGFGAQSTKDNQVVLGSGTVSADVTGAFSVGGDSRFAGGGTFGGALTNITATGTNKFPAGADISFGRYAISSLVDGTNNAAVPVGTNVFVEVSGPSATFGICGLNGAPNRDGKLIILLNQTGYDMTLAHQSGVEPTAANRIISLTGADQTTTGNGAATLIYSATASRWIILNIAP